MATALHLLSTFVTAALLMLSQTTASSSLATNNSTTSSGSRLSVIWPRAVVAGSTTVMWIVDDGSSGQDAPRVGNVSVRLATAERVFDEKTVTLEVHSGLSAVELAIPKLKAVDGQLTVRLDWSSNSSQEFPIHPLDPIQSLSLRLERSIYQPDQVVSIWISCLDHRGRLLMTDECPGVQVAIHDPNNIIVQYWNDAMAPNNRHHQQQQQQQQPFKNLLFQLSNHPAAATEERQAVQWTVRASVAGQDLMVTCNFKVVDDLSAHENVTNVIQPPPTAAEPFDSSVMMVESHFVELDFSPRTASTIHPQSPLAGELIAGTSEKGIVVGLDVKNHLGTILHHQTLHLNRTSTAIFTVPALHNLLTTNATLQGTLMSIDGQTLDNQFVLATHQLMFEGEPSSYCRVQLFSHDGRYRFQEGDILHLAIYSSCKLRGNRIGYAVTSRSSGHVISWSQEMIVREQQQQGVPIDDSLLPLNLSIPIIYEMIPGAIVTVFLVDESDSTRSHLASNSLDIQVDNRAECQVQLVEMKGNRARVNLTLASPAHHHCLYGSWQKDLTASASQQQQQQQTVDGQNVMTPVETVDRFLHLLLPKYQQSASQWQLFDTVDDLWFVQCYQPRSEPERKEIELVVGRSRNRVEKSSPVLTLLAIDEEGRVRRSASTKLSMKTAPWSVDFALPQSVRVGEELIVDVTLTNHFHANCSQTQLQMALTGGATFVANGKKYLQQPACLAPKTRSVYRVGILLSDEQIHGLDVTLTAQLRGSETESCCTPLENSTVINLDHHRVLVETLPVSRTVQVLAKDFENTHSDNYLFCLGENTFVSNASSFHYEMLPLAHQAKTVVFQASAPADLRVILSVWSSPQELSGEAATYHLVLGGDDNMNSWISKEFNGLSEIKLKIPTPKILRQDRLQTFWISWDQHKLLGAKTAVGYRKKRMSNSKTGPDRKRWQLSVGKGSHIGVRTLISIPLDASTVDADFRFVGFSTGFGFPGFFRVWGTAGETIGETTRTLNIVKPNGAVTTQRAEIKIKGGIGASLDDVWSPMVSSSDSMTLTSLLENFHRERLASGGGKKVQAKNDWNRMLQNILSFRLADGSFHDGDRISDLRLTALTAHVLSAIKSQSYSDPGLLESAFIWMHGRQNDDGSFSDVNQSDSRSRIVLTSFILTCLADVQHDNIVLYQLSSAAQRYLETQLTNSLTNDVKIVVPMATAVLVSHSSSWPSALAKLDSVYDHLLDCYTNDSRDCLSEMAYCLTAYFHQNRPSRVLEMIKSLVTAPWQSLHPMEKVRAMKAWSKYGQVLNDPVRNLNVRLAFQDGEVTVVHSKHLNDSLLVLRNETVPQPMNDYDHVESNDTNQVHEEEEQHVRLHTPPLTYDVPHLPQNVEFSIAGTGCAILQTQVHWTTSMPIEPSSSLLAVYSSVVADEGNDQTKDEPPSALTASICVQWKGTERTDLTVHLEMFSSYVVTSVVADDGLPEIKYRTRYNNATIDINQVKSQCSRCVKVQAVRNGLVRDMQPGRIEVREKSLRMTSQQWLLNAPDSHSSVWAYRDPLATSQLKSRPATCS